MPVGAIRRPPVAIDDLTIDTAGRANGTVQVREAPATSAAPPVIYGTGRDGTKQPVCRLTPFSPRQGQRITVTCRGISGKVAVALKKSSRGPVRRSHVVTLSGTGRGSIPTKRLRPGGWYTRVKWDGKLAHSTNFHLRPAATKKRRAAKQRTAPTTTKRRIGTQAIGLAIRR